jgi:hypothetical protein
VISIYYHLSDYIKVHFNLRLYLSTVLFLSLLVFFNFKYDFEDTVIDSFWGSNLRILWFCLFHSIPYYIVCLFVYYFSSNKDFIRKKGFWIVSAFGLLLLGIDRGEYFSISLANTFFADSPIHNFIFKVIANLMSLATVIIPLALFYFLFHRKEIKHFYGIHRKNIHLKPYFLILAAMVPLIAAASFERIFLDIYPFYRRVGGAEFAAFMKIKEIIAIILYEFTYAFSFLNVELLFRGFLIFGLVKYLGKDVILPMAVTYCILHFGKPMGEAVSSFFGGYILGVLALQTRNIYGGIIVHIGIALMMELFAFWQM